jgi:hypothetical protein
MKNISNADISAEKCTKCPTCGETSWYVMECDCGHIFCKHCTTAKNDEDSESFCLECPKCGEGALYV